MEMVYMALACVYGLFLIMAYRKGLSDGLDIMKGKDIEPVIAVSREKEDKGYTNFDARTEAILRNIDNYDGTSEGQKVIE